MRVDSLRRLTTGGALGVVATALVLATPAGAQDPVPVQVQAPVPAGVDGVEVRLTAPPRLREGDRAEVIVEVMVRPAGRAPVLLTPVSEGQAVEVVRGRLLRADAVDPTAAVLRFRLPIVARSLGTSVLRVRARAYACRARCRLVESSQTLALRVERRN